ncbi:hypothetical protein M422DRAFT_44213 [Sphaerobolus stellatus SS14]|nr:hypothetical protein M422DRAFT_44213 [Sphaerobolus stellatus SS14]
MEEASTVPKKRKRDKESIAERAPTQTRLRAHLAVHKADTQSGISIQSDWTETGITEQDTTATEEAKAKRVRKKQASDNPFNQWKLLVQNFLEEFLRHEGRGDHMQSKCPNCPARNAAEGLYCCEDCAGGHLCCQGCVLKGHACLPFHRIMVWTADSFFRKITLKSLGLHIQLGHSPGEPCLRPHAADKDFCVIDTLSIHLQVPHTTQLLRHGWYPATMCYPATVCTFQVLEHFQILNLQSKCSAYEYYNALTRLTDNTGLETPPDRYQSFLIMCREWRHLKMLKRMGRSLLQDGAAQTKPGALALECPACPQPGRNMPAKMEDVPKNDRNIENDPTLGDGLSYFVGYDGYMAHIAKYREQKEISTCVKLDAITLANTRNAEGHVVSGVAGCVCTRHGLMCPLGIGDMQRGEKYCNVDYIFLSALHPDQPQELIISYDISCQWYKNLESRVTDIPTYLQIDMSQMSIRYLVPKFHLASHVPACQTSFSFNYTPGTGRTDGEGIEREWALLNPVAYSTREMTHSHRQETLNDHIGDGNWRKMMGLGSALDKKIHEAVPERIAHHAYFQDMCQSLTPEQIKTWTDMVVAWELDAAANLPKDTKAPNPYMKNADTITEAQIRLELQELEAQVAGAEEVVMHDTSPTEFLIVGLDLQEIQYRMQDEVVAGGGSSPSNAIQQQRKILDRKLNAWELIQAVYMPGVAQLRLQQRKKRAVSHNSMPPEYAEDCQLMLPSEIPKTRGMLVNPAALCFVERRLREGQARAALQDIRHFLPVARYRRAWNTLQALDKSGEWSHSLKQLKQNGVRGLMDPDPLLSGKDNSVGRFKASWIWSAEGVCTGTEKGNIELQDCLRVKWCKARARYIRWREEIILVREEMKRVAQWLAWRAQWWCQQCNSRSDLSESFQEAMQAHCLRQSDMLEHMRAKFLGIWKETWEWVECEISLAEDRKNRVKAA